MLSVVTGLPIPPSFRLQYHFLSAFRYKFIFPFPRSPRWHPLALQRVPYHTPPQDLPSLLESQKAKPRAICFSKIRGKYRALARTSSLACYTSCPNTSAPPPHRYIAEEPDTGCPAHGDIQEPPVCCPPTRVLHVGKKWVQMKEGSVLAFRGLPWGQHTLPHSND